MPTGSLCAERNVIGTALSDDLSIRRQGDIYCIAIMLRNIVHLFRFIIFFMLDLRMIAVLSVSMSSQLGSPQQSTPLCLPTTAGTSFSLIEPQRYV